LSIQLIFIDKNYTPRLSSETLILVGILRFSLLFFFISIFIL
jgi:hypothetical protein